MRTFNNFYEAKEACGEAGESRHFAGGLWYVGSDAEIKALIGIVQLENVVNGTKLCESQIRGIPLYCRGTVYCDGGFDYRLQPFNFGMKPWEPGFEDAVRNFIAYMSEELDMPESGYISADGRWFESMWALTAPDGAEG